MSSWNSSAVPDEQLHTNCDVAGCQHLWSASQRKLIVPLYRTNSFGRRCFADFGRQCFAVVGPSTCNSLPDSLHDPAMSLDMFRCQLKTCYLVRY